MGFLRELRAWLPLLLVGAPLTAQSFTVPSSSDMYRRMEAVSALFPIRGLHLGQRPMSRREVARILTALSTAVDSAPYNASRREWARAQIVFLELALGADSALLKRAALSGRAQLRGSDARIEQMEANGLGLIDARTSPFTEGRYGWPATPGTTLIVAPTVAYTPHGNFGFVVEPRFDVTGNAGGWTGDLEVNRAYARGTWKNVAMQLGADEMVWGQSPHGALFISGNAQPFPGLLVGTDTAFTMPWLFRLAGPIRMTGLLADLGPSQDPPHARLTGWQVSIQPWSRFELGVSVLVQTGGNGAPPATFFERLVDLFPAIDALAPQHADLLFSNKVAGGNLRLRMPELSGLDIYYELQIDDFDARRLKSSFVDDMAHLVGARIAGGPVVWRAEWHRTSLRLYEHTQFRSGVSFRHQLIGSPLGPNARAGYLGAEWQLSPDARVDLTVADERRDPSQYTVTVSAERDRGFKFIRLTDDPDVRRARAVASLERGLGAGALRVSGGYNRAWRTGQPARHEWMGQLSLAMRLLPTF